MGSILLDVTILGEPVGQGRPRAVRMPFGVRMHPPKKSAEWEALAAQQLAAEWTFDGNLIVGPCGEPVCMTIEAVNARPKTIPKKLGSGRLWRTSKPDLDNVIKAVADSLVKAGVLRDDTLIADIRAVNLVAADGESPHVRIVLEELDPLPLIPWPDKPRAKAASAVPHLDI